MRLALSSISVKDSIFMPANTSASGILGVTIEALGNNTVFNVSSASVANRRCPLVATMTGSITVTGGLY